MKLLKRMWTRIKPILVDLELPILVFPVLVVMIVATTFLFPSGRCGAWQWWLAVGMTIALCFYKAKDLLRGLAVSGAFLLALVVFWVMSRLISFGGYFDSLAYHMPAIRLMIGGWNPVWQGTLEGITEACGISSDCFNAYHIIAMPRGVWYFDTAAYYFFHNQYNLLFPLAPFLLVSALYALGDAFSGVGRCGRIVVIAIFACTLPTVVYGVDVTVAISAIGLLTLLHDSLKSDKWSWIRLVVFSFWMASAKQTGLLHCCVFWAVFASMNILSKNWKRLRRMLVVGSVTAVLFGVVSVSPYLSAYANFGHPFYPRYSCDEQTYPTLNITGDFFDRNDDAAAMGHIGAYVNAFISSDIAHLYYRIKSGNKGFNPVSRTWKQNGSNGEGTPTFVWYRACFVSIVVALFLLGGAAGRFVAISIVLGTLAMPTEMIGYLRYTPWALGAAIFCVPLFYDGKGKFRWPRCELPLALLTLAIVLPVPLIHFSYYLDDAYAINSLIRKAPPRFIIQADGGTGSLIVSTSKLFLGNLVLFKRQEPFLASSELVSAEEDVALGDKFYMFPCNGFVVSSDCEVWRYSEHEKLFLKARNQRLKDTPLFVLKTLLVTLPKSIWEVLHG